MGSAQPLRSIFWLVCFFQFGAMFSFVAAAVVVAAAVTVVVMMENRVLLLSFLTLPTDLSLCGHPIIYWVLTLPLFGLVFILCLAFLCRVLCFCVLVGFRPILHRL